MITPVNVLQETVRTFLEEKFPVHGGEFGHPSRNKISAFENLERIYLDNPSSEPYNATHLEIGCALYPLSRAMLKIALQGTQAEKWVGEPSNVEIELVKQFPKMLERTINLAVRHRSEDLVKDLKMMQKAYASAIEKNSTPDLPS